MVGYNTRFLPGAETLAARIACGELGDVHHVEANYVRQQSIPGRGGWFTRQAVASGGAIVDIGVHVLDPACHFQGFPTFSAVEATISSEFGSRHDYTYLEMYGEDQGHDRFDVEDSVRAFVSDDHGTSLSVIVAWAGQPARRHEDHDHRFGRRGQTRPRNR
jgi:predicted dehydrogenase